MTTTEYLAEDFKFTLDLLKRYAYGPTQDTALFRAVCDHNLNIILAALAHAEAVAPHEANIILAALAHVEAVAPQEEAET